MKKLIAKLLITNFTALSFIAQAQAATPAESGVIPVCGVLESFNGHVQVFDASRSHVIDVTPHQKLLCGSWVSVEDGVATISHHQGFTVQVGAKSFAQILDPAAGSGQEKDHFTLMRGQMVMKSAGKKSLQVSTANARVIVNQAEAYLIYSTDFNETQVLGISGQTEIQNRYLETRGIRVSQSQYSTLGFNPNRPTPAQPKVVAMKAVQSRLDQMGVSKDLASQMLGEAKALVQTQLPVSLKSEMPERGLASVSEHPEFSHRENQSSNNSSNDSRKYAAEESQKESTDYFRGQSENVISNHAPSPVAHAAPKSHANQKFYKKSSRSPASVSNKTVSPSDEKQKLLKKLSEIEIEE